MSNLSNIQGPAYLAKFAKEDKSLEGVKKHSVPHAAKVINDMSATDLKKRFPPGNMIARPIDVLLAAENEPITVIPIHVHTEYQHVRDRRDQDGFPVVERSYDENSELAKRCRDSKRRSERYPGHENKPEKEAWIYRWVSVVYMIAVIDDEDHPLYGQEVSFAWRKGEWTKGRNFCNSAAQQRRKINDEWFSVPLYLQRWNLTPKLREKGGNKWYGFDATPHEDFLVPETDANRLQARNEELRTAFHNKALDLKDEDDSEPEQGGSGEL